MPTNNPSISSVQTSDRNVNQLQQNIVPKLNYILRNPILNNNFLVGVVLAIGENSFNHLLGRALLGWVITDISNGVYVYTVTAANATVGDVYANNGNYFTVLSTIAAATTLRTTGQDIPLASGTLTRISGTGDATITFSSFKLEAASIFRSGPSSDVTLTLTSNIPAVVNIMVF